MNNKLKLLIADDDKEDVEILLLALEEINFLGDILIAQDGIEVIKLLNEKENIPDMILLDMNMPRMGGEECLLKIREIDGLENVPVVIYTTSSYPGEKDKLLTVGGASEYLTKEFSFKKIVEQIERLLQLYTSRSLTDTTHS